MHPLTQKIQEFKSNDDGAIAIIFGLIAVVFVAFGGISIDLSRTYSANSRAGAALDAAILAAGDARIRRGVSNAEAQEIAQNYFAANIASAGNRVNEFSNFRLQITNEGTTFSAFADVSVPMHFAGLVSVNQIDFTATSSATFDQLDLELGLMLDVTGSMNDPVSGGSGSKLDALKRAVSDDLLDTLMPNGNNPRVRVGYAPYSAAVNVGSFSDTVRDRTAPSSDNCVVERTNATDVDSAPEFNRYFRSVEEANATIIRNQDLNRNGRYNFYECPNAEVLPLTSNKSQLVQTINGYSADGRTAGHLGIAWAWYLISPNWASIWGADSAPRPYPANADDSLIKAVVLLTDGEFNSAYGGSDLRDRATNESYERTRALCRNIRDENVIVYAIGFAIDGGSQAERELQECASTRNGRRLYFASANEDDLSAAFREIADSLTNLRLTR